MGRRKVNPFIYGLFDPVEPDHIRYVGMTMGWLNRPRRHEILAKQRGAYPGHTVNWVRSLLNKGRTYSVLVLEEAPIGTSLEIVCELEKKWISFYRQRGDKLTNSTDGGDGSEGRIWSENEKDTARERMASFWKNPEFAQARSEAQKRRWSDPSERDAIRQKLTGIRRSEETREKLRQLALGNQRGLGHIKSAEVRQDIANKVSAGWAKRKGQVTARKGQSWTEKQKQVHLQRRISLFKSQVAELEAQQGHSERQAVDREDQSE